MIAVGSPCLPIVARNDKENRRSQWLSAADTYARLAHSGTKAKAERFRSLIVSNSAIGCGTNSAGRSLPSAVARAPGGRAGVETMGVGGPTGRGHRMCDPEFHEWGG